jgi:hypothetical protein
MFLQWNRLYINIKSFFGQLGFGGWDFLLKFSEIRWKVQEI